MSRLWHSKLERLPPIYVIVFAERGMEAGSTGRTLPEELSLAESTTFGWKCSRGRFSAAPLILNKLATCSKRSMKVPVQLLPSALVFGGQSATVRMPRAGEAKGLAAEASTRP